MKSLNLKALCRAYASGSMSDAQILSQLQVSADVAQRLSVVLTLPIAAQKRIRIEDLMDVDDAPLRKSADKPATKTPEKSYGRRLQDFVDNYYDDDDDKDDWVMPIIERTITQDRPQAVHYKFKFNSAGYSHAFYQELLPNVASVHDSERLLALRSLVVTVPETLLEIVNLVPPFDVIKESF